MTLTFRCMQSVTTYRSVIKYAWWNVWKFNFGTVFNFFRVEFGYRSQKRKETAHRFLNWLVEHRPRLIYV